jgi:hypothetical protein
VRGRDLLLVRGRFSAFKALVRRVDRRLRIVDAGSHGIAPSFRTLNGSGAACAFTSRRLDCAPGCGRVDAVFLCAAAAIRPPISPSFALISDYSQKSGELLPEFGGRPEGIRMPARTARVTASGGERRRIGGIIRARSPTAGRWTGRFRIRRMLARMAGSLYVDSSLWSRLTAPPLNSRRIVTEAFLRSARRRYRLMISDVVVRELYRCKTVKREALFAAMATFEPKLLELSLDAERIGRELVAAGHWKKTVLADMTHVAYTMLSKAAALATWDEDDLARDRSRTVIHGYAVRHGLWMPLIGTPEELSAWLDVKIR